MRIAVERSAHEREVPPFRVQSGRRDLKSIL
ncbi:MAG: hypothetical protein JFAIHJKO_00082 [Pyrinomonadaceae bacterium]|nr:hypothetical protein [Pyrinomonadaceae bacterium]